MCPHALTSAELSLTFGSLSLGPNYEGTGSTVITYITDFKKYDYDCAILYNYVEVDE